MMMHMKQSSVKALERTRHIMTGTSAGFIFAIAQDRGCMRRSHETKTDII